MICLVAEAFKSKGFQEWIKVHRLDLDGNPVDRFLEFQRSSRLSDSVPIDPSDCAACFLLMGFEEVPGISEGVGCRRVDCRTIFRVQGITPETERQNPLRLQINLNALGINIF